MAFKYLMDENVDPVYTKQLRRLKTDLFILAVGELTAPPRGTLDPEILCWCEEHDFILVTNNRKSIADSFECSPCSRSPCTWHPNLKFQAEYWRES